jgi:hypothetical protein
MCSVDAQWNAGDSHSCTCASKLQLKLVQAHNHVHAWHQECECAHSAEVMNCLLHSHALCAHVAHAFARCTCSRAHAYVPLAQQHAATPPLPTTACNLGRRAMLMHTVRRGRRRLQHVTQLALARCEWRADAMQPLIARWPLEKHTVTGAEYVESRRRHSCGDSGLST